MQVCQRTKHEEVIRGKNYPEETLKQAFAKMKKKFLDFKQFFGISSFHALTK
jgi:hypothetical protein